MIYTHGPPTYFVTLSAADTFWPEVYLEICRENISIDDRFRNLSRDEVLDLNAKDRGELFLSFKKSA